MEFAHFEQIFPRAGETAQARYDQLWREIRLCDELGFDYAFGSIHHLSHLRPQAAIFATMAAERTTNLRVGPMGYTVSLYNPIRIVEEIAVLDNVTGGRLEVGLTTGVTMDEFRVYGADWDNRSARARETLRLIVEAFGRVRTPVVDENRLPIADHVEPFDFDGPYNSYTDIRLSVDPVQRPHPPLWLISLSADNLELSAELGADTGYLFFRPLLEAAERIEPWVAQRLAAGHGRIPRVVFETLVYVDETDAAATAKAEDLILSSMHEIYGGRFGGGGTALADVLEKLGDYGHAEIRRHMFDYEYLLDNDIVIVGSPATVAEKLHKASTDGLFNVFAAEFNVGHIGDDDLMRSIRLFGEHVVPELKGLDPIADLVDRLSKASGGTGRYGPPNPNR